MSHFHLDATQITQAGMFLSRHLEEVMPDLLEERLPELWGADGSVIPTTFDLTPGVRTITQEVLKRKGEMADFYSPQSTDISLVNANIDETKYKALDMVKAFSYNVMELNAAQVANRPIVSIKEEIAMRNIEERRHIFALVGSEEHQITGLYNDPNVPPSASGYNPNTSSAQDDIDFVRGELQKLRANSQLTSAASLIIVPNDLLFLWSAKLLPGTGNSVLSFLTENMSIANGTPVTFVPKNEAKASFLDQYGVTRSNPGDDRLIFVPADLRALQIKMYLSDNMPPQLEGLDYLVYMYGGQTETIIHRPLEMLYSDITPVA